MSACGYCGSTILFGGEKAGDLVFCNAACLEKGHLMTPVQIGRNLYGCASGPDPGQPSKELARIVKLTLAQQSSVIPGAEHMRPSALSHSPRWRLAQALLPAVLASALLSLGCAPKERPKASAEAGSPPAASSSPLTHFAQPEEEAPPSTSETDRVLKNIPGIEVRTSAPEGWRMPSDQKPESADYYYPGAASPTFMMVGAACRSQSFEEIIQMDLDRLTSQGEGRDATAAQTESLREGTVLVYRYDDEGNHYYCRTGYRKVGQGCMLKFMICSNPDKLSDKLLQDFRDFILRTEIVQVDTASSNAGAFAEARRRVQAAGKAAMTDVKYGGGDGTSYETAITIQNVANGFGCVSAQYAWLDAHMPGCQMGLHGSDERQGREYSILGIECDGEEMELYFDITECEKREQE